MIYIYHYMSYQHYQGIILLHNYNKYYHLYNFCILLNIFYMFLLKHLGKFLLDKYQHIEYHLSNQFDILYIYLVLMDNNSYIYQNYHKGDILYLFHMYQLHIIQYIFLYKELILQHIFDNYFVLYM